MKSAQSTFVTPSEAAQIIGCAVSTIYLAISRGELIPVHPDTKLLRRADAEKYNRREVGAPVRTAKTA